MYEWSRYKKQFRSMFFSCNCEDPCPGSKLLPLLQRVFCSDSSSVEELAPNPAVHQNDLNVKRPQDTLK